MKTLTNISVILVNPKYPENIGSVCRAMKTMGLQSLSLVSLNKPEPDKIKTLAVHAFDIMEKANHFPDLQTAIRSKTLVAGISRRRGKKRKYFAVTPEELAVKIHSQPRQQVALVFGNEETGLSDSELEACHLLVKIPSSPDFPSLNLSHAVQLITYVIFREQTGQLYPLYTPISGKKLEYLTAVITQTLKNIGFFKLVDTRNLGLFFRDILARASLSGREAKRLEVVFRKISGMVAKKGIDL